MGACDDDTGSITLSFEDKVLDDEAIALGVLDGYSLDPEIVNDLFDETTGRIGVGAIDVRVEIGEDRAAPEDANAGSPEKSLDVGADKLAGAMLERRPGVELKDSYAVETFVLIFDEKLNLEGDV